ncbi:PTS system, sucrose-specific IIB component [Pediococcus damnosus]|uniref:PTS beta-glucoside transporter subunit IIBCA n=1 Tax=Pediococcus damnosus TaxID=51663 RepID=UPI00078E5DF5|nr:PTS transporter subunit IIBCA [Pediococcus damnosus]AMV70148.1 PTS system, sucrose-specific IIB component [Pediococcus damnosus]
MKNETSKYKKIADQLINIVGKDNIESITHCVTRLRIVVKNRNAIDDDAIQDVDEVKGVFYTGGQYQIILGTGIVNKVFDQVSGVNKDGTEDSKNEETTNTGGSWIDKLKRGIRILSDVYLPIVPILGATGLFLGLKGVMYNPIVLSWIGMTPKMIPNSVTTLLTVLTGTAFNFLPAFICWSAFKKFGGTPVIGFLIGLMLVSPSLPNAYDVASGAIKPIMLFNIIPIEGYQGSVLTALFTGIIGAKLEKRLRRVMPNSMDLIFTPFVVVLVMLTLAFLGFGPIVHLIEQGLVHAIRAFLYLPFGIGGFLIGVLYPLCVMTGLHQMSIVVETSLLAATHFNPMITVEAMYGFANAAVCLALALHSCKASQRSAGISATATQILGVSEPALFGVVLRAGLPALLVMVLCSGLGGGILSLLHIQANSYGLAVALSPLMYIYSAHQLIVYVLVGIGTFIVAFLATNTFAIPKDDRQRSIHEEDKPSMTINDNQIGTTALFAPVVGKVISLNETNDPVFSQKLMGDGFAVEPTNDEIMSPVSGKITMIAETKHAVGITTKSGLEILVHMGIDTVSLKGKPFDIKVKVGDSVHIGQKIAKMNVKEVKADGKDATVMVVMTNMNDVVSDWKLEAINLDEKDYPEIGIATMNGQ